MKILILFLLILTLAACRENKILQPGAKNESLQKYSSVNSFDQLFELKETITLDTSKEALIKSIASIYKTKENNFILFHYMTGAKVFSKDGKFLFALGKKGAGPGEYISPFGLAVINNTAYVYDQGQSFLILYNLTNGGYIKNIKLRNRYSKIISNDKKLFMFPDKVTEQIVIEVFDAATESFSIIELSTADDREKLQYLGALMFGTATYNNYLAYCYSSDFKINYYDIDIDKPAFRSNYIPARFNITSLPGSESEKSDFFKKHALVSDLMIFSNGLTFISAMQREANDEGINQMLQYFILYDNTGNYLGYIKHQAGLFMCGNNLIEFLLPTENCMNGAMKIYNLKE